MQPHRPSAVPGPADRLAQDTSRVVDHSSTLSLQSAEATPLPLAGLNRYEFLRALGEGGFGKVLLARDTTLQREVVIKLPRRMSVATATLEDPFLAEARVVASLEHPHIAPIFDVGRTPAGQYYLVCRYLEGGSLAARLRQGRCSAAEAAALIVQLADALHFAHQHGVTHRDIKPDNILFDRAGQPYLADFGLALRTTDSPTGTGICGTPAYMSPEQARGDSALVDGRSDIFSLGVVFYELLVGQRPFQATSLEGLLHAICQQDARPPRQIDDSLPRELEGIVLRMLARHPLERYSTAKDVADELRQFLASRRLEPPHPVVAVYGAPPARTADPVSRALIAFAIIAVLVAVTVGGMAVLGAAFFYLRAGPADHPTPVVESSPLTESPVSRGHASEPTPPTSSSDAPADGPPVRSPHPLGNSPRNRQATSVETRTPERVWRGHTGPIRSLTFSADGSRCASGSDDQTVRIWTIASSHPPEVLRGNESAVTSVAFSPDGAWLAWGGKGGPSQGIEIMESATKTRRRLNWTARNYLSRVQCLTFSQGSDRLAAGGSGPTLVWNLATGELIGEFTWQQTLPSYVYALAFAPQGKHLAQGCHGGSYEGHLDRLRIWDLQDEGLSEWLLGGSPAFGLSHAEVRSAMAYSPDGQSLARVTPAAVVAQQPPSAVLSIWSLDEARSRNDVTLPGGAIFALIPDAQDGWLIAVATGSQRSTLPLTGATEISPTQITLFRSRDSHVTQWEAGHAQPITILALSRDGKYLASASDEGDIRLWNLTSP
ncbi:MAG: serine/threonine-protein kinase [Pirellulales bacterium]